MRPTKLTTRHLLAGGTAESAERLLQENYHVTPARSRLAAECSLATVQAARRLRETDVSLYLGIPFCPTRCVYCSFVSQTTGRQGALLEPYLDALEREIEVTARLLRETGRTVHTLYIGGGTPTTLSTPQLRRLMQTIRAHFDLSSLIEYTVEGGRPDTLDSEKLRALKALGCGRVSINPQTMQSSVLRRIGRCHSPEQTRTAYLQAREAGFEAIADSLSQVLELQPANITVHTLALKKGADLYFSREELPTAEAVREMLADTETRLRAAGYKPYYLYRQKYMSGSFENVGWTKPGFECLYNIYMMEELHSIISLGGGGMTKINLPDGRLERLHNPKFPQQYLARIDDVLAQKAAAAELFR